MELVNGNYTNLNFENLMCIAVNFYVKLSGHQEALTGLNRGTPFCTSEKRVVEQMQLDGFQTLVKQVNA